MHGEILFTAHLYVAIYFNHLCIFAIHNVKTGHNYLGSHKMIFAVNTLYKTIILLNTPLVLSGLFRHSTNLLNFFPSLFLYIGYNNYKDIHYVHFSLVDEVCTYILFYIYVGL